MRLFNFSRLFPAQKAWLRAIGRTLETVQGQREAFKSQLQLSAGPLITLAPAAWASAIPTGRLQRSAR